MSISVDYDKLESVMQFSAFLDVLKDPKALDSVLTDIKAATQDNKAVVEARTKLDQIDAYVAQQSKQVDVMKADFEKKKADFAKQIADKIASEAEFAAYMKKANDDLSLAQSLVAVREKDVTKREIDAKAVDKKQADTQLWLDTQKATLDALQADLDDKAAKLKALLG